MSWLQGGRAWRPGARKELTARASWPRRELLQGRQGAVAAWPLGGWVGGDGGRRPEGEGSAPPLLGERETRGWVEPLDPRVRLIPIQRPRPGLWFWKGAHQGRLRGLVRRTNGLIRTTPIFRRPHSGRCCRLGKEGQSRCLAVLLVQRHDALPTCTETETKEYFCSEFQFGLDGNMPL
jgi:hypothetical protein